MSRSYLVDVYNKLFQSNSGDITIKLADDTELKLHRDIICVGNNFFDKILTSNFSEKDSKTIDMTNYDPVNIKAICKWLYTNDIDLDIKINGNMNKIIEIYMLS